MWSYIFLINNDIVLLNKRNTFLKIFLQSCFCYLFWLFQGFREEELRMMGLGNEGEEGGGGLGGGLISDIDSFWKRQSNDDGVDVDSPAKKSKIFLFSSK